MSSEKDHAWYLTRRSRALNDKALRTKSCDYVLCWLQQTLRGESNPVIDSAVALGHLTGKPVLVYHGLGQHYPHASDRLHQFILEASRSLEQSVQRRGIRFIRYVETTDNQHPGLVYKLASRACAVVLDDQAAFVGRWQAQQVASKLDRLVIAVNGTRLVPEAALGTTLTSTVQFRQRHTQLRDQWLQEPHDLATTAPPYSGDLAIETTDLGTPENCQISKLIARCSIDHGVPAVKGFSGDRTKAITHLYWSLSAQLPGYSRRRNNPAERATSYLSPYLHFGVLWPGDITQLVLDSDADSRDQWRFLDELLTWREFFHHNACHEKDPTAYTNVPLRARQTLDKHSKDQRQTLYSLDELVPQASGKLLT